MCAGDSVPSCLGATLALQLTCVCVLSPTLYVHNYTRHDSENYQQCSQRLTSQMITTTVTTYKHGTIAVT